MQVQEGGRQPARMRAELAELVEDELVRAARSLVGEHEADGITARGAGPPRAMTRRPTRR